MIPKREAIIDGLAGLPVSFTEEISQLRAELFDSNGSPIKVAPEDMDSQIQKSNKYCQMLQKRNGLWLATLN